MKGQYERLLRPGRIGALTLKNRVVFNPCETLFSTVNGEATQRLIDFYVRRAEGGAALLVVHSAQACSKLDPIDPTPPALRVDDNAYIPMLTELTEAVHRAGAKIALLVSAGGGAQSTGFPYDRGLEGVADIQNVGATETRSLVAQRPVRRLSVDEIKKIIEVYGLSARRVLHAGFDAFHIHAMGGFLISQFISPRFNTREDEYGGDFERRIRFLLEIVDSCRKNVGPAFPLVVRMSIDEFFPGGRGVEESIEIARRLEAAGVDAIDAIAGVYESVHMIIPPIYLPKGCLVDLAAAVKKEVRVPVIAQGRLYDPELAEGVLRDGKADFIGMTRGILADPDWVKKVQDGREEEIRRCISCNQCIDRVQKRLTIRCAINPTAGREIEFQEAPPKSLDPKKVVVVGSGPGGMEAARVAGARGHNVTLFEKGNDLGAGQLKMATVPPFKDEFQNIARYYRSQFEKLKNVKIVLKKEARLEDIKKESPDVVILATGGSAFRPEIEGVGNPNVTTIHDVMAGKTEVRGNVIIAGGGCAGAGAADWLSERGVRVTVVEMLDDCAMDEEVITRLVLMARLRAKPNVRILTGHTITKINHGGVTARNSQKEDVDIPADFVVLAFGAVPCNPLEREVDKHFDQYYVIGDAKKPRKIKDAVAEGFFVGQRI